MQENYSKKNIFEALLVFSLENNQIKHLKNGKTLNQNMFETSCESLTRNCSILTKSLSLPFFSDVLRINGLGYHFFQIILISKKSHKAKTRPKNVPGDVVLVSLVE